MKIPLPRDRALAGTSREVTSNFLKELEGEGVLVFSSFEDRCISYIEHDNKFSMRTAKLAEKRSFRKKLPKK